MSVQQLYQQLLQRLRSLSYQQLWSMVKQIQATFLLLLKRFIQDDCPQHAAALTYTTLFAVVPLMTVTYSMLSVIPALKGVGDQVQAFLFSHFVPATGEVVQQYLTGFSQQARQLTVVGVVFLIITAFLMIVTIERVFNRIWGVARGRRGLSSFLLYWAVLSLGPLLLGAGFFLSSYVASLPMIMDVTETLNAYLRIVAFIPFILGLLTFTLLYMAIPNCPVPFRHAVLGGFVAAALFELAKRGFTLFVVYFPSYELIYGAFAAVPLFLFWIYVSWLIVLLGAVFVRVQGLMGAQQSSMSRPLWVLVVQGLFLLWQQQKQGLGLSESSWRQKMALYDDQQWAQLRSWLQEQQWIQRGEQQHWFLSKDAHDIDLWQLLQHAMDWSPTLMDNLPRDWHWPLQLSGLVANINQLGGQQSLSLADLFAGSGDFPGELLAASTAQTIATPAPSIHAPRS